MSVTLRNEADVGYVEVNDLPVTAHDQAVCLSLLNAVRWAEQKRFTRVILSGADCAFTTGVDARDVNQAGIGLVLQDVANAIEESFVPWIAVIDGDVLGGWAEIAMACRMRIMAPTAQIGVPEVSLGVIPSAGGTQRLPRLVGLEVALDMISLGQPLGAQAAHTVGLVHAIEDDPIAEAFLVNTEELGCIVPTWELPAPEHDQSVIDAARAMVSLKRQNQAAPLKAINTIEHGLSVDFHDALLIERSAFIELETSAQAKALRHIFSAEQVGKTPVRLNAIGDRLLARYHEAADTVFMDGSTPWEVDEAMVEFGFMTGPYEDQDMIGLDIAQANRNRHITPRDPDRRYIPIADRMIELGKLGRKTGAGWYRYPGGNGKVDDPIVADLAIEESYFAKRERTDYSPDEICNRLLLAMINEAADILLEGIVQSATDIDLVIVARHGFPRWRGGLLYYADSIGMDKIVDALKELEREDPIVWKISAALLDCVRKDVLIADYSSPLL